MYLKKIALPNTALSLTCGVSVNCELSFYLDHYLMSQCLFGSLPPTQWQNCPGKFKGNIFFVISRHCCTGISPYSQPRAGI